MAHIKFHSRGSSAAFGNFGPGDRLICSDEQAKHFVEEAQCASYETPPAAATQGKAPIAKPEKATKADKPAKTTKKPTATAQDPAP